MRRDVSGGRTSPRACHSSGGKFTRMTVSQASLKGTGHPWWSGGSHEGSGGAPGLGRQGKRDVSPQQPMGRCPGPGLGAGAGHGWHLSGDEPGPREAGSPQTRLGPRQDGIAQPGGAALPSDVQGVGGRREGAGPSRRQNLMGTRLTAEELTDPTVPLPTTKGGVRTEGRQLNKSCYNKTLYTRKTSKPQLKQFQNR